MKNSMKIQSIASLLILTLALTGSVVGCKKGLQKTTPLPPGAGGPGAISGEGMTEPIVPEIDDGMTVGDGSTLPPEGVPQPNIIRDDWIPDRETFAAQVVYFDFDKSNVRVSEVPKVEAVYNQFKDMLNPNIALRMEGHCDERGTEEYNRALGERRALSVREFLIQLGLDPQYVETISFGEDQPAVLGSDEAAWAKNRRAEFVILRAPGTN